MDKREVMLLTFLCIASWLLEISYNIAAPFLPLQCELHGHGDTVTGAMLGILYVAECAFCFLWSKLTSIVGRKNMLVGRVCWKGITTMLFGTIEFIPYKESVVFAVCGFIIRILTALGTSAGILSLYTITSDIFEEKRSFYLGVITSLLSVGMLSGPAAGGWLFEINGFWTVFVGTGGFTTAISIVKFCFMPDLDEADEEETNLPVPHEKILFDRQVIISIVIVWYTAAKLASLDPLLEPELRINFHSSEKDAAMVFLFMASIYACSSPLAGKLVEKTQKHMNGLWFTVIGLCLSSCAFLFAGPCPLFHLPKRLWLLLTSLGVFGASAAITYIPCLDALFNVDKMNLSDQVNKTAVRAFMSAMQRVTVGIGMISGMLISGGLGDTVGWEWAMTVFFGFSFLMALIVAMTVLSLTINCCRDDTGNQKVDTSAQERSKLLADDNSESD